MSLFHKLLSDLSGFYCRSDWLHRLGKQYNIKTVGFDINIFPSNSGVSTLLHFLRFFLIWSYFWSFTEIILKTVITVDNTGLKFCVCINETLSNFLGNRKWQNGELRKQNSKIYEIIRDNCDGGYNGQSRTAIRTCYSEHFAHEKYGSSEKLRVAKIWNFGHSVEIVP